MKKLLILLSLVFALVGCSASGKEVSNTEVKRDVEQVVKEEVHLPVNKSEWKETLKKSKWYKDVTLDCNIEFEKFIDFDGDGVLEYIVGATTKKSAHIDIGSYDVHKQEWSTLKSDTREFGVYIEPRFIGILNNGNGKEIAVITIFNAGASGHSEEMKILKVSETQAEKAIIDGYTTISNGNSLNSYTVDSKVNSLTISNDNLKTEYILDNNYLISDDGYKRRLYEGVPFTSNEELITLLDNSFFNSGIKFGDTPEIAKDKDPNYKSEGYNAGGLTVQYDDYCYFYTEYEPNINTIMLFNLNNLIVSDLEKVIKQKLKINSDFIEMDNKTINHFNFVFENYHYYGEVSFTEKEPTVTSLSVINNQ
ncbi:hypothetical protein [Viridibacillus arvi]|uniref:hypothetical protein n=1 Tax=Viridibacillus arvi TaxID=263475 RepID=UPI0034CEF77D